jgi:hypothetical protein
MMSLGHYGRAESLAGPVQASLRAFAPPFVLLIRWFFVRVKMGRLGATFYRYWYPKKSKAVPAGCNYNILRLRERFDFLGYQ